jgi:membrane protein
MPAGTIPRSSTGLFREHGRAPAVYPAGARRLRVDATPGGTLSVTQGERSARHVNPEQTGIAVSHAVDEVQHAARPGRRSPQDVISWAVAIVAGATVAWRSLQSARGGAPPGVDAPPMGLDGGATPELVGAGVGRDDRNAASTARPSRSTAANKSVESKPRSRRSDREKQDSGECAETAEGAGALLKELWCRFQTDELMTRAQALAFIGVLSLGPVLLFALAALGFVIHDAAQVEGFVHGLVAHLLPGRQASEAANSLIAQTHIMESARALMKGKWWAVTIGVLSLLWAADGLFVGASDPMNASWNVRESRSFVKLRLVGLGVFLAAGVLFLFSLVPSSLPSLIGRVNLPVIGALPPGQWWIEAVGWLLAIVVDAAMFTVIYKYLPNAKVTWKAAMFGGVVAGVMWELFKKGFAVYLAHFGDYNKLYGALGGAVLLVTWIWYSCVLLLVGAIICKMYKEHAEGGGVVKTSAQKREAA